MSEVRSFCIGRICDFGSAKKLVKGETNVSYICSRYYRAPELIFGATEYTNVVDIWSAGCVIAEMIMGKPIFPGETGVDQLVEVIKVLGTPSRTQLQAMNPHYMDYKFPSIKAYPLSKVFKTNDDPESFDLISKLLQYEPERRLHGMQSTCHPFFEELRQMHQDSTELPDGAPLPNLFNYTKEESEAMATCVK